jgi:hypothetical protein
MKRINRWAVVPHLPMTQTLYKNFPANAKKKGIFKSEIASEKLCGVSLCWSIRVLMADTNAPGCLRR